MIDEKQIVEVLEKWEDRLLGVTAVFPPAYNVVARNILKLIEAEKKK